MRAVRASAVGLGVVYLVSILGISIALLFPFGAWLIAFGITWKDEPVSGYDA